MSESLWQDIIDWMADAYEDALGVAAYPNDPVGIKAVYKRLVYDTAEWSQNRDFWKVPMLQIYGVSAQPRQEEQMSMGGGVQGGMRSLRITYPIYAIGVVEGGIDDVAGAARVLSTRMQDVARSLPRRVGEVAPATNGEMLTEIDIGAQTLDTWSKATTDKRLAYYVTVVQSIQAISYAA